MEEQQHTHTHTQTDGLPLYLFRIKKVFKQDQGTWLMPDLAQYLSWEEKVNGQTYVPMDLPTDKGSTRPALWVWQNFLYQSGSGINQVPWSSFIAFTCDGWQCQIFLAKRQNINCERVI